MLSRDKQLPATAGANRNNNLSLTYDMQNTSTKLILLNFSKKEDNRIRGHGMTKEISVSRSSRSCHCLSESAPACACHHRDKDLSLYPGRHNACYNTVNNEIRGSSPKRPEKSHNDNKLPPCNTASKEYQRKSKNDSKQKCPNLSTRHRKSYNRDSEILYSMPYLSHPDFTMGQRRVLLSLARIYTNLSPIKRIPNELSINNMTRSSKGTHNKKSKEATKKKSKTALTRRESLQTAVKTFTSGNDKESDVEEYPVNHVDKIIDRSNGSISDTELDALVEDWVVNIIQDQTQVLSQEYKDGDYAEIFESANICDEILPENNYELVQPSEHGKSEHEDDCEEENSECLLVALDEIETVDETKYINYMIETDSVDQLKSHIVMLGSFTGKELDEEEEEEEEKRNEDDEKKENEKEEGNEEREKGEEHEKEEKEKEWKGEEEKRDEEEKREEEVNVIVLLREEDDQINKECVVVLKDEQEEVENHSTPRDSKDEEIDLDEKENTEDEEKMGSETVKIDITEQVDGQGDNVSDNVNVLRYISDDLRRMIINK